MFGVFIDEKYFCFTKISSFEFKIVKTFCTNFVSAKILLSTFCESQFKRNLSQDKSHNFKICLSKKIA